MKGLIDFERATETLKNKTVLVPRGKIENYGEKSCPFCDIVKKMVSENPVAIPLANSENFHLIGVLV